MDKLYKLHDLEFEWDEEKYAVNLRKHNVKFEEAAEVFFDPGYQLVMLQSKKNLEILLSDIRGQGDYYW